MSGLAGVLLAAALAATQERIPFELQTLVDAERAFAKTAAVKGIRDSFLDFFADDAIAFNPAPISATERLRGRPARPFSEYELTWEPRTGDIATSGEMGWLTGPSTFIDRTDANAQPQHGNYLSVWRRRGDGPWRVFIDIGTNPPQAAQFQPGFTRFPFASRYRRKPDDPAPSASLTSADRALNDRIGAAGAAQAYAEATTDASRLHRSGSMPQLGTNAIRKWLAENAPSMTAATGATDSAWSGDLGFSYGTYEVKRAEPEKGAYVRVWTRDATGKWFVVADVTQPVR